MHYRKPLPKTPTPRELEVISLLRKGMTTAEIGSELNISPRTVTAHIANAREKTGAPNRVALVVWEAA